MALEAKDIVGPALALFGTIAVALIGYWQWRRNRQTDFLKQRQEAYKIAWEKMEQVHLYVRSEDYNKERFNELMREVNVHLTRTGLYLDHGEKKRINDYLESLRSLAEVLNDDRTGEVRKAIRELMHDTVDLRAEVMQKVMGLQHAYEDVERKREAAIDRFRRIIGAS